MPKLFPQKRARVMKRAQELGHCICDPKLPCPCDVFTDHGICPCAGERLDTENPQAVRLTALVRNAGCASKIAPTDLQGILSRLPKVDDPAVITGVAAGDDAGVYKLSDDVTLVQTVDVFTPCVDEPYAFGQICAANCLSDIYAMGAKPKTALSVVAFPSETQDGEILYLMLKGAMETLADAGCALIGGHSIKDQEIKLGFAITGTVATDAVELDAAKVGDKLVLTKPLGVGVLNFALQIDRPNAQGLSEAEASMKRLNKEAAEAMIEVGVSACTDVTGFGLFGHLINMARHSGVTARVDADKLPAFSGALELLTDNVIPGAIERNAEYVGVDLSVEAGVDEARKWLGFDAQTSGGLLISVPKERDEQLRSALVKRGIQPAVIGEVVETSSGRIELVGTGGKAQARPKKAQTSTSDAPETAHDEHDVACCVDVFGDKESLTSGGGEAAESMRAFGALMRSVGTGGAIDERTKELITFSLVLLSRCKPCLEIHYEKAKKMGISQAELDEAAWCAVAIGGACVKMFYAEYLEKLAT